VDSSLVTSIAARPQARSQGVPRLESPVRPEMDERRYAADLARRLDLPFIVHELTPEASATPCHGSSSSPDFR
jgi:asparagine synthetase B (glutamine-hydrolysing)